jgi:GT2 family glycosyltransferase/glycosyltransferase involved in cell wall biosynthesis
MAESFPSVDALPDRVAEAAPLEAVGAERLFDPDYIRGRFARDFATPAAAFAACAGNQLPPDLDPSPFFVSRLYKLLHPDVARKGLDCLRHYLEFGRNEQRTPHPLFDPPYVLAAAKALGLSVDPADVYFEFLAGNLPCSPHKLIDLDHVRQQGGEHLGPVDIFRLLADPDKPLAFSPHPLFDLAHYSRANDVECANELIDYLIYRAKPKSPSPFFDDTFYGISAAMSSRSTPPLLHYLEHWDKGIGSPCILIHVLHLNHNLIQAGITFTGDPISAYVTNRSADVICHPEIMPSMISFAFANFQPAGGNSGTTIKDVIENFYQIKSSVNQHQTPDFSIIILNYHKPILTFLSVCAALNAMRGRAAEIIVVENAGDPFHFEVLSRAFADAPAVRWIKLRENRLFGEGNNIAVDFARGKYIMLLNNDCFLQHDFGDVLHQHLQRWPNGCVGACLVFPNGLIQEFGAMVSDAGQAVQRAKGLTADFLANRTAPEEVDYVSAACVILPRATWRRFAGFDPAFEPCYYEDADLMRRIRATGGKVRVNPLLRAVHIENATTGGFLSGKFEQVIEANRSLFARRWFKHEGASVLGLADGAPVETTRGALPPRSARTRPLAVLYTPFDIGPGGGERYLLSTGSALSRHFDVAICSQVEISSARVRFALNALGIAAFPFRIVAWDELIASDRPDLLVAMGNEIVPPIPAIGRHNWFILQFPFPWRNVAVPAFSRIKGFECVITYSDFAADWSARRFREFGIHDHPRIEVIHPAARTGAGTLPAEAPRDPAREAISVVNVGRFFVGGHSKRQDIFLDIIEMANRFADRPVCGTLIGTGYDNPDSVAFLRGVESRARESGQVRVILGASHHELMAELGAADIYLHCAGYDVPEEVFPERLEHFGITIIESIFAGCYPVLYDAGGPREILRKGGIGRGFNSISEAAEMVANFSRSAERYRREIAAANADWFARLTDEEFGNRILSLAEKILA